MRAPSSTPEVTEAILCLTSSGGDSGDTSSPRPHRKVSSGLGGLGADARGLSLSIWVGASMASGRQPPLWSQKQTFLFPQTLWCWSEFQSLQ